MAVVAKGESNMNNVRNLINGAWSMPRWRTRRVGQPRDRSSARRLSRLGRGRRSRRRRRGRGVPVWRDRPVRERSRPLRRLADLIDDNTERLARLESEDQEDPRPATEIEIPRAAANFRYFAGAIEAFSGEMHQMDGEAINYTLRRARGVAGCISPWNLPLYP